MTFTLISAEQFSLPVSADPVMDLVADSLSETEYDDISYCSDPPALVCGMTRVEIADLLDSDLDGDMLAEGIRARAVFASNSDRLRHLKAHGGALTDELDFLRKQEVALLEVAATVFMEDSFWSPENLLLGQESKEHFDHVHRASHHYLVQLSVEPESRFAIKQSLTSPLVRVSSQTITDFQYEIEHYFSTRWNAEVELLVGPGLLVANRESLVEGIATSTSLENTLEGSELDAVGQSGELHDESALIEYLQTHEHIDTMKFLSIRQPWTDEDDPLTRMAVIGANRMSIEEWSIALGIVSTGAPFDERSPKVKPALKLLRAFTLNGRIDGREELAAALDTLAQACGDRDCDFVQVAVPLAARLRSGPMVERPAPRLER